MPLLTNSLNSLISVGNDAYSNLFRITFSGGTFPEDTQNLSVRCSGFTPPAPSQKTYPAKYITATIDRPVPKVDINRNFTLTFRLDDYWEVYSELLKQQKQLLHASKSFVSSDSSVISSQLFNVQVDRIVRLSESEDEDVQRMFNYRGCWIENLTPSGFNSNGSNPVTCTCSINFLTFEDWQSGLSDVNSNETTSSDSHMSPMTEYKNSSYV